MAGFVLFLALSLFIPLALSVVVVVVVGWFSLPTGEGEGAAAGGERIEAPAGLPAISFLMEARDLASASSRAGASPFLLTSPAGQVVASNDVAVFESILYLLSGLSKNERYLLDLLGGFAGDFAGDFDGEELVFERGVPERGLSGRGTVAAVSVSVFEARAKGDGLRRTVFVSSGVRREAKFVKDCLIL